MSPKEFAFKLTVPRDPQAASLVEQVAGHAVRYAEMDAAAGAAFVARVGAAAAVALAAPGLAATLPITVTCDASGMRFAIDAESVTVADAL